MSEPSPKFPRVLVSAGPMRSPLDPARYLQNRSSGKMGLFLAEAAARSGRKVTVLLGPVEDSMKARFAPLPVYSYQTAAEYDKLLTAQFTLHDVFISAAAVLDFSIHYTETKQDRRTLFAGTSDSAQLVLPITKVPDFVKRVSHSRAPHQKVIAFAAEAGDEPSSLVRAKEKLREKGADGLLMNRITANSGPDQDENELWFLLPGSRTIHLGRADKKEMGARAWQAIEEHVLI